MLLLEAHVSAAGSEVAWEDVALPQAQDEAALRRGCSFDGLHRLHNIAGA